MSVPTVTPAISKHKRATPSLGQRVVRGAIVVAGGSYVMLVVGFVANLALTRALSPRDFGLFALAQFAFAVVNLRPKVGIGSAFAQNAERSGALAGTHLTLDLGAAVASIALAGLAVIGLHYAGYASPMTGLVLALALIGVSDAIMGTAWILLDKSLHVATTSIVSTVAFIISYIPTLYIACHGGGYWSLVAQNAAYSILLIVGLWPAAKRQCAETWSTGWRFDRQNAGSLLRFGRSVGAATVMGLLITQLDNVFVGTFVGVAALGLYSRAYNLAQWPSRLVTNVITQSVYYTYTRVRDDRARLSAAATMSLWIITTLALPIALGIVIAAPDLVRFLYGPRWSESALYLRFLAAYAVFGPLLGDAGWLLTAAGRPRLSFHVMVLQAMTLAVAGLLLTIRFGVLGTCVAVGISFTVALIGVYRQLRVVVDLPLISALGIPAIAATITLAMYAVGWRFVAPSDARVLPVIVVAKLFYGSSIYLAVLLILDRRQAKERIGLLLRLARGRRPSVSASEPVGGGQAA